MPEASATMDVAARISGLAGSLHNATGWDDCISALRSGRTAAFDSVWGSACALLGAALDLAWENNIVLVFPGERQAQQFADDWQTFSQSRLELFPTVNQTRPEDLSADPGFGQRLRVLKDLARQNDSIPVIATSIQAISHPVNSPNAIISGEYEIKVGSRLDLEQLKTWLVDNAYQPTSAVQMPGEFSSRGGIVDVFAPDWTMPARVELFDDEIESIRFFDPSTQRSIEKCSGLNIAGLPTGDSNQAGHLTDYFTEACLVLLVEPQEIESQSRQLIERQAADSKLHTLDVLQQAWKRHSVAMSGRLITETDTAFCKLPVSLVEQFSGDISNVRVEIDRVAQGLSLIHI